MALDLRFLPPSAHWVHTGKRPRYLVQTGPWSKEALEPHDVDATTNAQGDWVCHVCGELVRLVSGHVAAESDRRGLVIDLQYDEPSLGSQP